MVIKFQWIFQKFFTNSKRTPPKVILIADSILEVDEYND